MALRKVLVVDQFSGISPYWLDQHPMPFEDLVRDVFEEEPQPSCLRPARVIEVDEETFHPEWCTTCFTADETGRAVAWKWNWDSSG